MTIKASLFREIGVTVFGEQSVKGLSSALNINERNVQRMIAGTLDIPDALAVELATLIWGRADRLVHSLPNHGRPEGTPVRSVTQR